MRRLMLLALLLGGAFPAHAGAKAVYATSENRTMVIEVADNGDARIGPSAPEDSYGLLIGGQFYLVSRDRGSWQVARIEDQAAAFDRVMPPIFKTLFSAATTAANPPKPLHFTKAGTRTIAGLAGQVYTVAGLDPDKPKAVSEFVVTTDPALAPVGKALMGFIDATTVLMSPLIGKAAAEQIVQDRQLAALGTLLQAPEGYHLTSFAKAEIDPARLVLPAKPLTVDQIVTTMSIKSTP